MATCRLCRSNYPKDQFITGNGPRYLVCVRCGVDEGYVSAAEVPQLYDDAILKSRFTLVARRYSILFWLLSGWVLWVLFFTDIPLWGNAALVVLILATLTTPLIHFLRGPRYRASLANLTPE